MGYIIIDEDELNERVGIRNDLRYKKDLMHDVYNSRANINKLVKACKQEEKEIDEKIKILENKKSDLSNLLEYANSKMNI